MGPVITPESKRRIEGIIAKGVAEGADLLLDGRKATIEGYETGNFIKPSILENVALDGELIRTEIFGPVMSLLHMDSIDEAIASLPLLLDGDETKAMTRLHSFNAA